jgi:hypothetical protein
MNELIQGYLGAIEAIKDATENLKRAEEAAESAELPKSLRPAEARDIVVGEIVWYPRWKVDGGDRCWSLVEEVLRPSDEWKAYCSHDGCRYGLDGAFIEITNE